MSFATIIRTASERGLIKSGWDQWITYRAARNLTSHTYDESKANEVCQVIPSFLDEVKYLSMELDK